MSVSHLPLIIGLVAGFVFLVLFVGLTWVFFLYRRRRNAKRQWQESLRADLEKHRLDIQIVHSEAAFDTTLTHSEKHDDEQPPYYREDRFTSRPQPHSRTRRSAQGAHALLPPAPPYDPRPPPVRPPRGFSAAQGGANFVVPTSIARDVSYDSCDSASVYSTASPPLSVLSLNDQVTFVQPPRPFAQPHTSSPLAPRRMGAGRVAYALPRASARDDPAPAYPITSPAPLAPQSAGYVDPLAPETYDKMLPRRQESPSAARQPVRLGYAESLRRKKRARAAEARETSKDRSTLPSHLHPALVPPSPSAQRSSTPLLYRKLSRPSLDSPFSPPPAQVW